MKVNAEIADDGSKNTKAKPGCDDCRQSGYSGRIALHELLVPGLEMKELVHRRATLADLRNQAIKDGMLTLRQDGIEKALMGLTDMSEVHAACGSG